MPKQISFEIPDIHEARIQQAVAALYPIPTDEKTGDPLYTADEWVDERLRRVTVDWVYLWEQRQAKETAVNSVVRDDSVISIKAVAVP
jgi:hypothetical protein